MIKVERDSLAFRQVAFLKKQAQDILPRGGGSFACRVGLEQDGVVGLTRRVSAGSEFVVVTLSDTQLDYTGTMASHPARKLQVVTAPRYGTRIREISGSTDATSDGRFADVGLSGIPRLRYSSTFQNPAPDIGRYNKSLHAVQVGQEIYGLEGALLDTHGRTVSEEVAEGEMMNKYSVQTHRLIDLAKKKGYVAGFRFFGDDEKLSSYVAVFYPDALINQLYDRQFKELKVTLDKKFGAATSRVEISFDGMVGPSMDYSTRMDGRLYESGKLVSLEEGANLVKLMSFLQERHLYKVIQ